MKLNTTSATERGRRGYNNEDRFLVDDDLGFYGVADGLRGHRHGELAAQLALRAVHERFSETTSGARDAAETMDALREAIQHASKVVYDRASADAEASGMCTTLTVAVVHEDDLIVAHVGDSRAYLIHQGRSRQLTCDHTFVAELLRAGALTPDEALEHRYRNVLTRAVGLQPAARVETLTVRLQPNDRVVLMTDGANAAARARRLADASGDGAHAILEAAREEGAMDNATAIVVEFEGDGPGAEGPSIREMVLSAMEKSPLADLSFVHRAELLSEGRVIVVPDNHVFIERRAELKGAYLVIDGTGSLHMEDGAEAPIREGDILGLFSLVGKRQALATVRGEDRLTLLGLAADDLAGLVQRRPLLGLTLYQLIAELAVECQDVAFRAARAKKASLTSSPPYAWV